MLIYLLDVEKREEIQVDLSVEYTTPGQDFFVIFYTAPAKSQPSDLLEPELFREYLFRKVSHFAGTKLSYNGCHYSITLGFYAREQDFVPFVINQVSDAQVSFQASTGFSTAEGSYDHNHENYLLFNYQEYVQLSALGLAPLSFREYITQLIQQKGIKNEQHTIYHLAPRQPFTLQKSVDYQGWSDFMDKSTS